MGGWIVKNWCSLTKNLVIASGFLLGGCSVMPASGPAGPDVAAASTDIVPSAAQSVPYALVGLTPEIVERLKELTETYGRKQT